MAVVSRLVTVEDVAHLPDDGCRYDLIEGELIGMSPAGGRHGRVAARLARILDTFVAERRLGAVFGAETGFVLARDPDVVLAPDAAFVRAERMPPEEEQESFLGLAPDLVAEVVSPSERPNPLWEKVMQYLDHGVRLVWVVQPSRKLVTVWTPDRSARSFGVGETLDGGDVLPGLEVPVADLFS